MVCPQCNQPMKIVAFIEDDSTIQKILTHPGLWETLSHSPPPSCEYEDTTCENKIRPRPLYVNILFLGDNRKGLSLQG